MGTALKFEIKNILSDEKDNFNESLIKKS